MHTRWDVAFALSFALTVPSLFAYWIHYQPEISIELTERCLMKAISLRVLGGGGAGTLFGRAFGRLLVGRAGRLPLLLAAMLWPNKAPAPVGYVDVSLPPGYSTLANALWNVDNTVESVFNLPDIPGMTVFKMGSTGFKANNYLDGWAHPDMTLTPGEGCFFKNPSNGPIPLTLVGEVVFGSLTNRLPAGFSVSSSIVPQSGPLGSLLGFPVQDGDSFFIFDAASGSYSHYAYAGAWTPAEPVLRVGQCVWANIIEAADWGRIFKLDESDPAVPFFVDHEPLVSTVGQLNFFTYSPWGGYGCMTETDGATRLSTNHLAQLYASPDPDQSEFVPLGMAEPFQSGSAAGYIRGEAVSVPFATGGQSVAVQLRAWRRADGASFEAAVAARGPVGRSAVMWLTAHSVIEGDEPGLPPPDVNGFSSFALTAPFPIITNITATSSGASLEGLGLTGEILLVQARTNLNLGVWQTLGTATAGANGVFEFLDTAATNYSTRFYRTERAN